MIRFLKKSDLNKKKSIFLFLFKIAIFISPDLSTYQVKVRFNFNNFICIKEFRHKEMLSGIGTY